MTAAHKWVIALRLWPYPQRVYAKDRDGQRHFQAERQAESAGGKSRINKPNERQQPAFTLRHS